MHEQVSKAPYLPHRGHPIFRGPRRGYGFRRFLPLARQLAEPSRQEGSASQHRVSARNQLRGIVTDVKRDTVMAQVEMCCGPYRVVSLMSREAADSLGLEIGVVAVASIKATNVVVEVTP